MSGYAYGEHEPTQECPYCKTVCCADWVDVGVGMVQCGPFHCNECGSSEIGSFDDERELTKEENDCGWYKPNSEPGSSANVIAGRIVSHVQARDTYQREFYANPKWEDKEYVDNWWEKTRKGY